MRATRLQSKRPALLEAPLVSPMKIEVKEEREGEQEAGAPPMIRERAKASTPSSSLARPLLPGRKKKNGLPERLGSLPLRCVLSGTNPSATAWQRGHAYAHRSNRFWPLLHSSPGIVPPQVSLLLLSLPNASPSSSSFPSSPFSGTATDDELLNHHAGLGLCDIGQSHPETDLSSISSALFAGWAPGYYGRLVAHVRRAAQELGCRCRLYEGDEEEGEENAGGGGREGGGNASSSPSSLPDFDSYHPSPCCAPRVIAFTGKRQFVELLNAGGRGEREEGKTQKKKKKKAISTSNVEYGLQPHSLRPEGWPRCLSETEVWVLTTTSGAAGLTNEARAAPYLELGKRLAQEPWPRPLPACCLKKE